MLVLVVWSAGLGCRPWAELAEGACNRSDHCRDAGVSIDDAGTDDAGVFDGGNVDAGSPLGALMLDTLLKADVVEVDARFGAEVAIAGDGSTIAVGAPGVGTPEGAVFVFGRTEGRWVQRQRLTGSSGRFGRTLAFSPNGLWLGVGAPYSGLTGSVWWFRRPDVSSPFAHVFTSAPVDAAIHGASIAFSDDNQFAVVGEEASNKCMGPCYRTGAVRSIRLDGGVARPLRFPPSDLDLMGFGHSVALARGGTRLFVGAPSESSLYSGIGFDPDAGGPVASGAVYLYELDGGAWQFVERFKAAERADNQYFGGSLAAVSSGDTLLVGLNSGPGPAGVGVQVGSFAVFQRSSADGGWREVLHQWDDAWDSYSNYGAVAAAADGRSFAVGGLASANGFGRVGVYSAPSANSSLSDSVVGPAVNSSFGQSVALSNDGRWVVVGAPLDVLPCTGPRASPAEPSCQGTPVAGSGGVYVYSR